MLPQTRGEAAEDFHRIRQKQLPSDSERHALSLRFRPVQEDTSVRSGTVKMLPKVPKCRRGRVEECHASRTEQSGPTVLTVGPASIRLMRTLPQQPRWLHTKPTSLASGRLNDNRRRNPAGILQSETLRFRTCKTRRWFPYFPAAVRFCGRDGLAAVAQLAERRFRKA